jgi:hypothetical protein
VNHALECVRGGAGSTVGLMRSQRGLRRQDCGRAITLLNLGGAIVDTKNRVRISPFIQHTVHAISICWGGSQSRTQKPNYLYPRLLIVGYSDRSPQPRFGRHSWLTFILEVGDIGAMPGSKLRFWVD